MSNEKLAKKQEEFEFSKGLKIIRPIKKTPTDAKSLENSLLVKGYTAVPGTVKKYFPKADTRGNVSTGLDENSIKLTTIVNPKVREQEINRVRLLRNYYENLLNESLDPKGTYFEDIKENGYALKDGDNIFDMSNPVDAVNYYWLMETGLIANSLSDVEKGLINRSYVNFYVYDSEVENKSLFDKKRRINTAIAKLEAMNNSKRIKVQKIIGLGLPVNSTEEKVYNSIEEFIRSNGNSFSTDPVTTFNNILDYSDDLIEVKAVVKDLLENNLIRAKAGVVLEGETVWAKSIEEFENFLVDPVNTEIFMAFKDKISMRNNIKKL